MFIPLILVQYFEKNTQLLMTDQKIKTEPFGSTYWMNSLHTSKTTVLHKNLHRYVFFLFLSVFFPKPYREPALLA